MTKAFSPQQAQSDKNAIDAIRSADLRRAFGAFATGVAVVTTRSDGIDVGMTINSFSSVSLEPPLVSWNLRASSPLAPAFLTGGHFAVHILSSEQLAVSRQFTKPEDRFADCVLERGVGEIPLLIGCCAVFECRSVIHHEVGDHFVLIGEVVRHSTSELQPLLFHKGDYGHIRSVKAAIS